jgi:C_GCAxxG_C_C family probable redox protein
MDKKQQFQEYLQNGFNCAQAVAIVFAQQLNIEKKTMLAATAGFGGGMGRQAMTCGALTGATIVLGFDRGQVENKDSVAKDLCYKSVQELFTQFTKIHGSTACKDLLNCDISTHEGFEIHKKGEHSQMCLGFIETVIDILGDMIRKE